MNDKHFSNRTVCPLCLQKVNLDEVQLTPSFTCPLCRGQISVSDRYKKYMFGICFVLSWSLPFLFGVRRPLILILVNLPAYCVLVGLYAYFLKHIFPPRLVTMGEGLKTDILGLK